jgi:hypothetical protein
MYVVNKTSNDIDLVKNITFGEAGFKERQHLQEWIAKNPSCLGEELLIIQKEFAGFDDTKERLDLLALDKRGNLVIIENKLDDTGRDVVWQALKYVSYCSSLTTQDIEQIFSSYLSNNNILQNAQEILGEFFGDEDYDEIINIGYSQRVILVAGDYRKEVTSTVMWLLNNGIDITCFKVVPYSFREEVLLDFKQIIPLKEAEEFMIKIAAKNKEDIINQKLRGSRHDKRELFWKKFLEEANKKTTLTQNLSPAKESWLPVALGMGGVGLNAVISGKYARCEVYINRGSSEMNKKTYDQLFLFKDEIEKELGKKLVWERMDDRVTSRAKLQKDGLNLYNEDDHEMMIDFLITTVVEMHAVFKKYVSKLER